jgi:hypothetical protein
MSAEIPKEGVAACGPDSDLCSQLLINVKETMRLPTRQQITVIVATALVALACTACGPEDGRPRAGGPGADVGNKPPTVVPKSKVFTGQTP